MPTPMPSKSLVAKCAEAMPGLTFTAGRSFYWSPQTNTVFFNPLTIDTPNGQMALLHEIAHAQLNHKHYASDAQLLQFEVAAWDQAIFQGKQWSIYIDRAHIEDCLDTYRDWLYARSTCPSCKVNALQVAPSRYRCPNCPTVWSVSPSRFCRPYRMQLRHKKTLPDHSRAVFR